ncbi:2327_t:CDS:2 [Dentiscutata erythropus]|uniref:2327_t:CDS:1 n=1 Tax=Dentiscutata erythropus TaxID=1348616 RepID=A0A9N8VLX5_9GLOM|nr:2327_t:CDS:2 [Dentiscutata erythropus]
MYGVISNKCSFYVHVLFRANALSTYLLNARKSRYTPLRRVLRSYSKFIDSTILQKATILEEYYELLEGYAKRYFRHSVLKFRRKKISKIDNLKSK